MGNPSWGKGWHEGYDAGQSDGVKQGAAVAGAALLTIYGGWRGGKWVYTKVKTAVRARREDKLEIGDDHGPEVDEDGGEQSTEG